MSGSLCGLQFPAHGFIANAVSKTGFEVAAPPAPHRTSISARQSHGSGKGHGAASKTSAPSHELIALVSWLGWQCGNLRDAVEASIKTSIVVSYS